MALRESALKHDALRSSPSSGTPQASRPENKAPRPFLKRRQWMEFNDQRWFPRLFRDMFNDNLDFLHRLLQPYAGVIGPLSQWTSRIGARQILDLASAGGGHVALLLRMAQQRELALPPVLMSDLYPSVAAWQEQQQRLEQDGIVARTQIGYVSEPVSALDVPPALPRIWTIFSAFHHFPPEMARAFLAHFCKTADGLCIAELQAREWPYIPLTVLNFFVLWFAPFFARRPSFTKILLNSLIPIGTTLTIFDGVVSCLRTYTAEEIMEMLPEDQRDQFEVEIHQVRHGRSPLKVPLVFITRKSALHQR